MRTAYGTDWGQRQFLVLSALQEKHTDRGAFFERALSFHSGALCPEQTYDRAGATAPVKREISGKAEL